MSASIQAADSSPASMLETALRRSEQRLRTIFETEADCVKVVTPDGTLLEINEAGVHMFEAENIAELKTHRLDDLIRPEHRSAFAAMQARVLAGEPGLLEFEIEGLRGTRRWLETHATAMLDDESGETVVLSICRDITQQKKAVKALMRNQTIVRQISGTLPLGFLVIDDRNNSVIHANQQFCDIFSIADQLTAIRSGELSGKDVMERCMASMVDAAAVAASCETLGDAANRSLIEDEIACTGGRTIRRFSTQLRDEQDRYVGRFYLFEDITARRTAERDRLRLEAQLQQAMKMQSVGRLAGGVAHDFNNMLGVIIGHTEIAMKSVLPVDPVHSDLAAILKAAERSAALTRQLLAFASKQTATPKRVDLNERVGGLLRLLQRLISEDVRLVWMPGPGLWPIRIDPSQVDQILTNLCVNARDAIANVGTITIETANCVVDPRDFPGTPDANAGEFVRLTVRDTGCGMDAATVAQIFEPFFSTKPHGQGTGLGLATVYGTVKQNDGFITVTSAPQDGSTFAIYLPHNAEPTGETSTAIALQAARRGRETVLVVEDEKAILMLVTHILGAQGYRVLPANSPRDALAIADAQDGDIALLLTDVIMPDMNGRDLALALRERFPRIRTLFMSGYTSDVIAKHGVLDDDVSFLQKPFSIDTLAGKVRDAIDREI
jgi:two-component system, cell cycle sensor histidine kinase and response regulator CckA